MLWWCRTLTWSCPLRPLLQLREPHLATFSENTGARMQCLGAVANRRYELSHGRNGSLLRTETLSSPTQLSLFSVDSANEQLREFSLQDLISKAILSSGHHQTYDSGSTLKCTVLENFDQNFKVLSFYRKRLIKKTYLQLRKRPRDICKPSNSYMVKTQFTIPKGHRQNLANPYSWSTRQVWLVKHIHSSPQPYSFSFHQTRPIYMAVPQVEEAWKSCLSLENEIRCRQCLGPNLQLYESDTGRKGLVQSLRKNQSKWASVLVSLCSVEEEPAFLFTLRSSKLKGRHKGDVSFAGGKSDPSDRDVVATALREAREELGVHVTTERVWGILKPLRDMSGMMIAPVLANIGPLEKFTFKPNPEEVEEIFTLSLSHLCNPQNRGYTHFRTGNKYGYTTPVFRNGKHRVWGLTAVALDHTLKLIVPP